MSDATNTLVAIARKRALEEPQTLAYTFLEFLPERKERHVSYGELDKRASAISSHLGDIAKPGERALLLYGTGFDFVAAFLGCLYAGVVAVPAPLARRGRGAERVAGMLKDCEASLLLCTRAGLRTASAMVGAEVQATAALQWVVTDECSGTSPEQAAAYEPEPDDLAFLQYSSGSTGTPRGAMITHGNILSQSALLHSIIGGTRESCLVSWLPVFHDMGLIAGVLQPLYGGYRGVLMAPEAFVESPQRWLEAISKFRGTFCAAPNFAYDLCVRRVPESVRRSLDLSCWRVASVAAEPVRAKTLDEFAAAFALSGFRREALQPGYGLAENTLVASLGNGGHGPLIRNFRADALEENRVAPCQAEDPGARRLVGSGLPAEGQGLVIVRLDGSLAAADEVGEVWLAGPSVSAGYWRQPQSTAESFHATLSGEASTFLRTGDLGFLYEGELFLCGRLKDLIILSGRNHHAPDIEATVEACHPALLPSSGAAFSIEVGAGEQAGAGEDERLVVVYELERSFKPSEGELDALRAAIQQSIVEHHEIQTHDIVFAKQGALPKTSSGKIQRRACRRGYLQGTLRLQRAKERVGIESGTLEAETVKSPHVCEAELWLIEELARHTGRSASALRPETAFADLGLPPDAITGIVRAIELHCGRMLPGDILVDYPTLGLLAAQLAESMANAQTGASDAHFAQSSSASGSNEPIAIVGVGCRYPGASGPGELWKLLCEGAESVTEIPFERWDVDEFYDPNVMAAGKMSTRRGGFLADIEQMDRQFFNLSVRETVRMDPQHRLMLETAWESLEDAGIPPDALSGTPVGVFVGISGSDYAQRQFADPALADAYAGQGSALTVAASRISHFFNFLGPAIAVDTACSSSLTAVHLACSSLHSGESSVALAGGVNVLLSPTSTMCLSKAGMMAPDGRCKAFDARANGYVRSEGAGIIVLKRLSEAVADGDPIYAVIRGTASNQDGHSSGLMAPNGEAQEAVILAACRNAGIAPGAFDYVEAHGTGTPVGDPIELKALGKVLSIDREPGTVCAVGSIKTNIGHTESAAGVAGLIKASLILRHRLVPASLHFEQPNPMIPFDTIPVRIPTELGVLPERSRPSLAGVNGFGVGGTNVHIVLEEAPKSAAKIEAGPMPLQAPTRPYLLPLSARSSWSLSAQARALGEQLRASDPAVNLKALCYTAAVRRGHMEHRLAVTGNDAAELAEALEHYAAGRAHAGAVVGVLPPSSDGRPKLAFVFSGQGSQWFGMGRSLLEREPVFRKMMELCDVELQTVAGWSLLELLTLDDARARLDETEFVQPALFAMQVSLAALLASWGVVPDAVAGHSVGEVAAAYVAGALTVKDALRLIAQRGKLMQAATGLGRMVSVEISQAEIEPLLNGWSDRLSIAAVNSPQSVVLSGESEAMLAMLEKLESRGVHHVALPVNYAFHSPQMDPFKQELETALEGLTSQPTTIPMYSTVTAKPCSGDDLNARYWSANLRLPVLLAPAIEAMAAEGAEIFLEIGPHAVLSGSIARTLKARRSSAAVISTLRRDQDEQHSLSLTLAALYTLGRPADWQKLYGPQPVLQTMPAYRWDRQRYWLDLPKPARRLADAHPLLGLRMPLAEPVWQSKLDAQTQPFLGEMQRNQQSIVPLNTFVEMALAAASELFPEVPFELTGILPEPATTLRTGREAIPVQTTAVRHVVEGSFALKIFTREVVSSSDEGAWQGQLRARAVGRPGMQTPAPLALEALEALCPVAVDSGEYYQALDASGLSLGASLRPECVMQHGTGHALVRLQLGDEVAATFHRFLLHPAVLEVAAHAARLAYGTAGLALDPSEVQRIRLFDSGLHPSVLYVRLRAEPEADETTVRCDITLAGETGAVLATLEGMRLEPRPLEEDLAIPEKPEDWLYEVAWKPLLREESGAPGSAGGKTWIIFGDRSGVAEQLVPHFGAGSPQGEQARCLLVERGTDYTRSGPDSFAVNPSDPEQLRRFFAEAFPGEHRSCAGMVHLWSLDATPAEGTSAASIQEDQALSCESLLLLVQAVSAQGFARPPRLYIATSGVHPLAGETTAVALSQSMVWGFRKVITIEHPELHCACVDLDAAPCSEEMKSLYEECVANGREDQVALRGAERYVARLLRPAAPAKAGASGTARPSRSRFAGPGEVQVRVLAARLKHNPPASGPIGDADPLFARAASDACLGVVVEAGREAAGWKPGDEVVALARDCGAPYLTVAATCVTRKPAALTPAEAAASIRPLASALLALREMGRLRAGESVLIHGAASELGLAAVQVARRLGLRILGSANNEPERQFLLRSGLEQVVDADSLASPSEILAFTGRKGVDALLNCMEDSPIPATIQSLAAFGRYLDGTRTQDALQASLGAYKLRGGTTLHAVDLDAWLADAPEHASALLVEVVALLESGELRAGAVRVYDPAQLEGASTVDLAASPGEAAVLLVDDADPVDEHQPVYRADGTYLITGGLGGLGLGLAERMVDRGARHLVLLGRSAPSARTLAVLDRLKTRGASVRVASLDVADEGRIKSLLDEVRATMPPLRGVMHAAGMLANELLVNMTVERFRAVMPSKLVGAWNLHTLTRDLPLDFFVLFSSLASLLGSPGQGNYAAANAFLDGLAVYRRQLGLTALSVCWGPWDEIGMAAVEHATRRMSAGGLGMLPPQVGFDLQERLLAEPTAAVIGAIPIDWLRWAQMHPSGMDWAFVSELLPASGPGGRRQAGKVTLQQLEQLDADGRAACLEDAIQDAVCQSLRIDPANLRTDVSLSAIGLDSIVALELKSRIEAAVDVVVQTVSLLRGPSIRTLAEQLLAQMSSELPTSPVAEEVELSAARDLTAMDPEQLLDQLATLSDEEVDTLLETMTDSIEKEASL